MSTQELKDVEDKRLVSGRKLGNQDVRTELDKNKNKDKDKDMTADEFGTEVNKFLKTYKMEIKDDHVMIGELKIIAEDKLYPVLAKSGINKNTIIYINRELENPRIKDLLNSLAPKDEYIIKYITNHPELDDEVKNEFIENILNMQFEIISSKCSPKTGDQCKTFIENLNDKMKIVNEVKEIRKTQQAEQEGGSILYHKKLLKYITKINNL